jgi:cell division septation protein DedD
VPQQIEDEGFHEIQLNGKQLVFLFMAATVVSVVIFLCGVLVGRGVKAQLSVATDNAPASTIAETTPTQPATPAPVPTAGSDPTTAAPPPATEELSYFNRLEKQNGPPEKLKPAGESKPTPDRAAAAERTAAPAATTRTPPPPAPAKQPASAPAPAPPAASAPAPAVASSGEPGGQGFAVQIAALNERSEADAIAKRLSSKGYAAYVLTPSNGTPSVFRVRVGKFNTRREAETVAARLQKEEQFKPWVTR